MKRFFCLLFFGIIFQCCVNGQVGINCDHPHQAAIMQMNAPDKGMMVPRIYQGYRVITDTAGADGLFYFDTSDNKYYYYTKQRGWQCLNPLYSQSPAAMTAEGIATFQSPVQINNSVNVRDTVNAFKFKGYGILPVGSIIMWSGTLADFDFRGLGVRSMDGWALCNGREYGNVRSPDLRGRFIVGAINGIAYGGEDEAPEVDPYRSTDGRQNPNYQMCETGGKSYHKLSANESAMPSHYHTGITNNDGAHYHDIIVKLNHRTDKGNYEYSVGLNTDSNYHTYQYGALNNSTSYHQHGFTTAPNAVSIAASAHENRPPYFAVAYLIRVK